MAKLPSEVLAHLEWLGFVQPTGLVVSAPAMVRAGAILNRNDQEGQRLLRAAVVGTEEDAGEDAAPRLADFSTFSKDVLGWRWSPKGYAGTKDAPIPDELHVHLPDYDETLVPDFAVIERDPAEGKPGWQLLVTELSTGQDLDAPVKGRGHLETSPHGRMERLLRRTEVSAGLLFNGEVIRLISAPRGESSGWMDFRVADMVQTAGRPICSALRLLLSEQRLLTGSKDQRLAALLEESRKFQNEVSERLAEQVLHALYEFMRGLQSAHDRSKGTLLRDALDSNPDEVYRALLNVVLRLVFLLYAEERDMLPKDEAFVRHYSLSGLFQRLREDAALYPDTMDQRYGAWAQLLVLFRMVYDGAECGELKLPRRHGVLFDPDRYPFLEGRPSAGVRQIHERVEAPYIPDGTVHRALRQLLILDGERISYRALDVEQIGSVYETMMGFRVETATGTSVAIKAPKKHGAPTSIDLDALLEQPAAKRAKWVQGAAERKLTATVTKPVKEATTLEDLHHALDKVIDRRATPDLVAEGALVLQPSEERRKSGSHYTPRALTEPIVRTTLKPILAQLREKADGPPTPDQILDLKVCDPAMGSGAFLVEACRQLGDELMEAWNTHDATPEIPKDEDEVVFARRLVAQRCLYGVDKNPVAVDLSKVSLWLATLAREHAFTFVDHALRHGDSLVGLTRQQIEAFHWKDLVAGFEAVKIRKPMERVSELRQQIRDADDTVTDSELRDLWDEARAELAKVRLYGDLVTAAFFEGKKDKERDAKRDAYAKAVQTGEAANHRQRLDEWRHATVPLAPFHWEIEFPEVFDRAAAGFDAFVGNPPFAGKNTITNGNVTGYLDWLKNLHEESHGNADLVAHFFRRAFNGLRTDATLGLIATNTIAQGDTRSSGLRWICEHQGEIYAARQRVKWPGQAAVVVSVLHVMKGAFEGTKNLNDREVDSITAFLFHRGGHDDPVRLSANDGQSFQGSIVLGMGFTFDDTDKKGVASPIAEMHRLIEENPNNEDVIFPYIGGQEVNSSPTHAHHRYVINFGERAEEDCRLQWPDLMGIVEERVKPERAKLTKNAIGRKRAKYWWHYGSTAKQLYAAIAGLERVLVNPLYCTHLSFAFLGARQVFANKLNVIPVDSYACFASLQNRIHEIWARMFSSTLKDDLAYAPSDCFETFPFPEDWQTQSALEAAGQAYYEFRADLMVRNDEGLTKTYNRFHDPEETDPEIVKLRDLHTAMDRAVLDAYGWSDIPTDCEFLLDYEIDEEEWGTKKKPYRYRWPEEVHDEVLARLLDLNAERAKQEVTAGLTADTPKKTATKRASKGSNTGDLFA